VVSRTDVTYAKLDKVLRSLGFSRREFERDGKGVYYHHKNTGAWITLPLLPNEERVVDYHLADVRTTLDGFGIADPISLAEKLNKAG
jgi:hypothetical protein